MRDPYHEYASEITHALQRAGKLPAGSSELGSILAGIRSDIADVRQAIRIVEQSDPSRFGIDATELENRRKFLRESERALEEMEDTTRYHDGELPSSTLAWEKEQQQQLLATQDSALNQIGSSLHVLRSQAALIGQETNEQVGMLGELDAHVDSTQNHLNAAISRMDRLVARTDARLGGWCFWLVALLLVILLIVVII
ncbi:hypothetical protein MCUN1_001653 [Malassezia cuniculi]|uniref:t-SNARE coiled-coil homology domain-containing protein n=1 Tax=Malassezia cuniculi TaxID=948313 RepID=A0AAF0ETF5_9BASI|nr:hypothetical protein MCUN1_001653 [Malassezia cuniculi]